VAVSDELLFTAQGLEIVRRQSPNKLRQSLARIEEIIKEYNVERIVLGYPKNMNNTEGERCEKTKEFKEMLERRTGQNFPVRHILICTYPVLLKYINSNDYS
jgi:putative Holliday junction resolvase